MLTETFSGITHKDQLEQNSSMRSDAHAEFMSSNFNRRLNFNCTYAAGYEINSIRWQCQWQSLCCDLFQLAIDRR